MKIKVFFPILLALLLVAIPLLYGSAAPLPEFPSDVANGQNFPSVGGFMISHKENALADADLVIVKVDAPDPVVAGETLTYTLTVTNTGPSAAQTVVVTETYDTNFHFGSAVPAPDSGTDNRWTIGSITPGEMVTITITGTVDPSATGSLSNTANVNAVTNDPDTSNNSTTAETVVTTSADLVIAKADAPDPVVAGETLTYTLTVTNTGPSAAQTVVVNDTVSLLAPEYSTDGGNTWLNWTGSVNLGTLVVDASREILIRGTVGLPAIGSLSNTANVNAATNDPDTSNNRATAETTVIPCPPTGCKVYLPLLFKQETWTLFTDDFSTDKHWTVFVDDFTKGSASVINRQYALYHYQASKVVYVLPPFTLDSTIGNYFVKVSVTRIVGSDVRHGIIFARNDTGNDLYLYLISPQNQEYQIFHYQSSGWTLLKQGTNTAIQSGDAVNQIRIEHRISNGKSRFEFYVNNHYLDIYTAESVLSPGKIGLYIVSGNDVPARSDFDDFQIGTMQP